MAKASKAARSQPGRARVLGKDEYVWLANGVGLEEVVGERALGLPPLADPLKATKADMPAAAKYGDGLIPLLQKKEAGLRKLGMPDVVQEKTVLEVALRHFSITVRSFEKANDAAHRGDAVSFRRYWLRGRRADFVADALFVELGMILCAAD